jgi:hypothetical protein
MSLTTAVILLLLEQGPLIAPLPGSALMGLALMGGFAAFARFPSSRRKRKSRGSIHA